MAASIHTIIRKWVIILVALFLFDVVQDAVLSYGDRICLLLAILAAVTMTLGNLFALRQASLKRMLAYSSIAHAGYLMIAVVCLPEQGIRAILFYLTVYALMTVGAFSVLAAAGRGPRRTMRPASRPR